MRIDTRPIQWVGVAILVGGTALMVAVLPRIAEAIPAESTVEAGTAVIIAGSGITPSAGWGYDKQAPILVLRKEGAQVNVFPASPTTDDAAAAMDLGLSILRDDPESDWQISEPRPFTTADGREGLYATAVTPTQFEIDVVVIADGNMQSAQANGSDTAFTTLQDEILTMLKTMTDEGAGS